MRKVIEYLTNLTKSTSEQSSKRFIALYVILVLVSVSTFRFTDAGNFELVLVEFLGFVGLLLGIGSWQNVQDRKNSRKDETKNE